MRFAHDVRVQECIVAFLNDDRVPLWVVWAMWAMWAMWVVWAMWAMWAMWAPTLQIYDFSLQILFQEMEIGHL